MSDHAKISYRLNIDLQNLNLAAQRIEDKLSRTLEKINPTLKDLQDAMVEHKAAIGGKIRDVASSIPRNLSRKEVAKVGLNYAAQQYHVVVAKEKVNTLREKYDFLLEEKRDLENRRIDIRNRIKESQKICGKINVKIFLFGFPSKFI